MSVVTDSWAVDRSGVFPAKVRDRDDQPASFKKTTMDRARKRLEPDLISPGLWKVHGEKKLGDTKPSYLVKLKDDGTHTCSCQNSKGGEFRRACSHAAAAGLAAAKIMEGQADPKGNPEGYSNGDTVTTELPATGGHLPQESVEDGLSLHVDRDQEVDPGSEEIAGAGDVVTDLGGSDPAPVDLVPVDLSIPDRDDPRFDAGLGPLPAWVEGFRPHQWAAIEEMLECFEAGDQMVWVDAPTGSGKSLIGEVAIRLLAGRSGKGLYVATTKHLQDQFLKDFDHAAVLKGRSNYVPERGGSRGSWGEKTSGPINVTCADCTKTEASDCRWCPSASSCPYTVARKQAMKAKVAVLNTAYLLTLAMKAGSLGVLAGRDVAILDEADLLESEVMNQAEVSLSPRRLKDLRIGMPEKKTVSGSWVEWVEDEALPAVRRALMQLPRLDGPITPQQIRSRKSLESLLSDLESITEDLEEGWVWDGYDQGWVRFKPIRVDRYGEVFGKIARKTIAMSATLISPDQMSADLGLEEIEQGVVNVPMTFPVENRLVWYGPVALMSRRGGDEAIDKMCRAVEVLVDRHPGQRVLVHTVSYHLAKKITEWLFREGIGNKRSIYTYENAGEKAEALRYYLETPGSVMVAASMDRGVDLPGEACEVQIIAKVPFPNLGDKRVNARLYSKGGQTWYTVQTIRTLVQMTGRAVRSDKDVAKTYVLDAAFGEQLWNGKRHLFPAWWREAVRTGLDVRGLR